MNGRLYNLLLFKVVCKIKFNFLKGYGSIITLCHTNVYNVKLKLLQNYIFLRYTLQCSFTNVYLVEACCIKMNYTRYNLKDSDNKYRNYT